jgi:hypothetical protein
MQCMPYESLGPSSSPHFIKWGGGQDTLICSYFENNEWHTVQSNKIVHAVQTATNLLKLNEQGIDLLDLVGAHLLCASGAMALKLHGFDDTATIMKIGQWTSLTFLQYIHTQIAHLAKDISKKMSMPLPFVNIAAIDNMDIP